MSVFKSIITLFSVLMLVAACGGGAGSGDGSEALPYWQISKTGVSVSYVQYDDGYYSKGADGDFSRDDINRVVEDNLNGLVWQDNDVVGTSTYTLAEAVQYCSNLNLASYSDWRLPNMAEYMSVIDYSTLKLNSSFEHKNPAWTSSQVSGGLESFVYGVGESEQFYGIEALGSYKMPKTNSFSVRCVRGDEYPASDMTKTGDFVIDNNTGLMWKDARALMSFTGAISYCETLTDGYSDWRLPNIRELNTIIDFDAASIDSAFTGALANAYWSSTAFKYFSDTYIGVATVDPYEVGGALYPSLITGSDDDSDGYYDVYTVSSNLSGVAPANMNYVSYGSVGSMSGVYNLATVCVREQ